MILKKILQVLFIGLLFCGNTYAETIKKPNKYITKKSNASPAKERSEKEVKMGVFLEDLESIKTEYKNIDWAPYGLFDEKYNWTAKFVDIKNYLYNLNFTSAYHSIFDEEFGKESKATLFLTKNLNKKYHIDYAFIRGFKIKNIEVGDYSDWIKHSDHMPLIIDIEDQD